MKRTIILFGDYFEKFIQTLNEKELKKLNYLLSLLETEDKLPIKFIKHIIDGLYELRLEYESNIYRVFFIFDEGNIVVLFDGFQKKTQKTPRKEINKALKIRKDYYGSKE